MASDPKKEKLWASCPLCHSTAYTMRFGELGPWSMEQECSDCGLVGPDVHFTAEPEPETEPGPSNRKEARSADQT